MELGEDEYGRRRRPLTDEFNDAPATKTFDRRRSPPRRSPERRRPHDDRSGGRRSPSDDRRRRSPDRAPRDERRRDEDRFPTRRSPERRSPSPSKRRREDDWNSGRGSRNLEARDEHKGRFSDAPKDKLPQRPALPPPLSFEEWQEGRAGEMSDGVAAGEEELQRLYDEYRTNFLTDQFFKEHKDEPWFRERYHPDEIIGTLDERAKLCQNLAESFHRRAAEGIPVVSLDPDAPIPDTAKPTEGDAISRMIYFPALLPSWSNKQVRGMLAETAGFESLSVSMPNRGKDWTRTAWATYDSIDSRNRALSDLKSKRVPIDLSNCRANTSFVGQGPREATESLSIDKRIEADVDKAKELIVALDAERKISANPLLEKIVTAHAAAPDAEEGTGAEMRGTLDALIGYLRSVHFYCYYCADESGCAEELSIRCSLHKRTKLQSAAIATPGSTEIVSNMDKRNADRAQRSRLLALLTPESLEIQKNNFAESNTKELSPGKFVCCIPDCPKAFKTPDFLRKHIIGKHPENVTEFLFRNAYLSDPSRPLNFIARQRSSMNRPAPRPNLARNSPSIIGRPHTPGPMTILQQSATFAPPTVYPQQSLVSPLAFPTPETRRPVIKYTDHDLVRDDGVPVLNYRKIQY